MGIGKQRHQVAEIVTKLCFIFQKITWMLMSKWFQRLTSSTLLNALQGQRDTPLLRIRSLGNISETFYLSSYSLFPTVWLPATRYHVKAMRSICKKNGNWVQWTVLLWARQVKVHACNCYMKLEMEEHDVHSIHCVQMLIHHTQALLINTLQLMRTTLASSWFMDSLTQSPVLKSLRH